MLVVREATRDDVDIVYELIIGIASHHDQERYVMTNKDELLRSGFGKSPQFGVLLAEKDGKVAGYASYTRSYSIWLGNSYLNIDDLFVWEQFRGQQIGEALMRKVQEVCQSIGISHIRWEVQKDNHSAIKFYESLGAEVNLKGICRWNVNQ